MRFSYRLIFVFLISQAPCVAAPLVDDGTFPTFWSYSYEAHAKAKKSRTGILWWFPVKGTNEEHEIFSQEPMNELSRRIIVVNVNESCRDKDELRKQYSVPDEYPTFVMTDYHGNVVAPNLILKRGLTQKIDPKKSFEKSLKDVQKWVDAMTAKLAKDYAKIEKDLGRKKYRKAIPALQKMLDLKGFKIVEKAQELYSNAIDEGRGSIRKAERLDKEDAIKTLRRIAKDFAGTEVAKEASKKLAELEPGGV